MAAARLNAPKLDFSDSQFFSRDLLGREEKEDSYCFRRQLRKT
jgi:hypothetical protein